MTVPIANACRACGWAISRRGGAARDGLCTVCWRRMIAPPTVKATWTYTTSLVDGRPQPRGVIRQDRMRPQHASGTRYPRTPNPAPSTGQAGEV